MKKFSLLNLLLLLTFFVSAQKEGLRSISSESLKSYMTFMASDDMMGRETGNPGNDASALFLKSNLMRMGVMGIQGDKEFYQNIPMIKLSTENEIIVKTAGTTFSSDSVLVLIPPFQTVESTSNVVFAGYGYFDGKTGYNDLNGIDIKDKIVIIMTGTPDDSDDEESMSEVFGDEEQNKLASILMRGPKALFMVYNPNSMYNDPYSSGLAEMIGTGSMEIEGKQIPGIPMQLGFITQYTADMILRSSGHDLSELAQKIESTGKPASFELTGVTVTATTSLVKQSFKSRNVVGIIEGSDPVLKNECILFSAHFDHTGEIDGKINNGADDNASGSAVLLETANAFMKLKKKPARSLVFVWVNGEEKGLLGSAYYAENPVIPLEKTLIDINLDMVGRSRLPSDTGLIFGEKLTVTNPGELEFYSDNEGPEIDKIINESAALAGIRLINKGADLEFGGSDHLSFREKGVTAIMFHSGIHADLHTERDDIEKIDFDKMEKCTKMCFLLGYKIANHKQKFSSVNKVASGELD
ncbi:MAG TPA: M20/M25/M40 family metallo-hydrolase [Bacteroidales bacterium]|nr:M20/M25/M40 family metallo-hydrolase [Bacteroidales bacterium]